MWRRRSIFCWALASATLAFPAAVAAAQSSSSTPGAYTTAGAWSFRSAPNLHPPKLYTDARTKTRKLAPGYFLTANFPNVQNGQPMTGQGGPLILDNQLQPVWFFPTPTNVVTLDLKQQTFNGKPALSWWEGTITSGGAALTGTVYVVNKHYRQVATLTGDTAHGWVISPHEVDIRGTDAWVTAYRYVHNVDLSAYGGSKHGTLYDSAVQEYDLTSGKLLYSWDAFNPGGTPNIPLSESEGKAPSNPSVPWDAYHVNSIQMLAGGTEFLVSMRNTWAAYLVDVASGHVIWTLGGKASTFWLPTEAKFQFQHTVQLLANNKVTIYDDHCCAYGPNGFVPPPDGGVSRGLLLKLDFANNAAWLVHQYVHNPPLRAAFTGSMERLPNSNDLVGWGSQPYFSEFTRDGRLLLDAVWPGNDLSYRVLLSQNWVGTPFYPPSGAVVKRHGRSTVYASWDGATRVVKWMVLAGRLGHLKVVATVRKSGFETAIHLPRAYRSYKVSALDARGNVLGTSGNFPKPASSGFNPGFY